MATIAALAAAAGPCVLDVHSDAHHHRSVLALAGADDLGIPFAASAPPAGPFLIWAGLYPAVFLLAAVVAFSRRDL